MTLRRRASPHQKHYVLLKKRRHCNSMKNGCASLRRINQSALAEERLKNGNPVHRKIVITIMFGFERAEWGNRLQETDIFIVWTTCRSSRYLMARSSIIFTLVTEHLWNVSLQEDCIFTRGNYRTLVASRFMVWMQYARNVCRRWKSILN